MNAFLTVLVVALVVLVVGLLLAVRIVKQDEQGEPVTAADGTLSSAGTLSSGTP